MVGARKAVTSRIGAAVADEREIQASVGWPGGGIYVESIFIITK